MASAPPGDGSDGRREQLQKRNSKSRLSKQDEVEEADDISPGSDESAATITEKGRDGETPQQPDSSDPLMEENETPDLPPIQNKTGKLVRSEAMQDELKTPDHAGDVEVPPSTLRVSPQHRSTSRGMLKNNSQGSLASDHSSTSALSRDSSLEQYTDFSGTDLEEFIKTTLNKNRQDALYMLQLEQDFKTFITSPSTDTKHLRFGPISSYHRMMVHRVAAFYGLDHNVDSTGKSVIISRASNMRVPDLNFADHIRDDLQLENPPKRILRKSGGSEELHGSERLMDNNRRNKSFEERQEEYHLARTRIFQGSEPPPRFQPLSSSPHISVTSQGSDISDRLQGMSSQDEVARIMQHQPPPRLQPYALVPQPPRGEIPGRRWHSTEQTPSEEALRAKCQVTKASSFGGLQTHTHVVAEEIPVYHQHGGEIYDSQSSGISSMGSSLTRGGSLVPPSPTAEQLEGVGSVGHHASSPSTQQGDASMFTPLYGQGEGPMAIWICTNIDLIPAGSYIINPHTGQPYVNPDGSPWRWKQSQTPVMPPPQQPQPPTQMQQSSSYPAHAPHTLQAQVPGSDPRALYQLQQGMSDLSLQPGPAPSGPGPAPQAPPGPGGEGMGQQQYAYNLQGYRPTAESERIMHPATERAVIAHPTRPDMTQVSPLLMSGAPVRYIYPSSQPQSNSSATQSQPPPNGYGHGIQDFGQSPPPSTQSKYEVMPINSAYPSQSLAYQAYPSQGSEAYSGQGHPQQQYYVSGPYGVQVLQGSTTGESERSSPQVYYQQPQQQQQVAGFPSAGSYPPQYQAVQGQGGAVMVAPGLVPGGGQGVALYPVVSTHQIQQVAGSGTAYMSPTQPIKLLVSPQPGTTQPDPTGSAVMPLSVCMVGPPARPGAVLQGGTRIPLLGGPLPRVMGPKEACYQRPRIPQQQKPRMPVPPPLMPYPPRSVPSRPPHVRQWNNKTENQSNTPSPAAPHTST